MKQTLLDLLSFEPDFETKLDILTSISITTNNAALFNAAEEVRNELVCEVQNQEVRKNILRDHEHPQHISNFLL